MTTDVMTLDQAQTAQEMKGQVTRIQEVMRTVMQEGQHFGVVPGCGSKPTLLKPGAEKLMMTFRLAVEPEVDDLSDSVTRRYRVKTRVTAQSTGQFLGAGVGECSSDEEKYAWREAVCPEEFDATDPHLRREKWRRGQQGAYRVHQVRTNPSDVANTILKMAKKRSLVDAILTVTAASDIFTQDLEDMPEEIRSNGRGASQARPQSQANETTGMVLPKYLGEHAGKALTDPTVSVETLADCASRLESALAKGYPLARQRYEVGDRALTTALRAEIARREREGAASVAPPGAGVSESGGGELEPHGSQPATPDAPSHAEADRRLAGEEQTLAYAAELRRVAGQKAAVNELWKAISADPALAKSQKTELYTLYSASLKASRDEQPARS